MKKLSLVLLTHSIGQERQDYMYQTCQYHDGI